MKDYWQALAGGEIGNSRSGISLLLTVTMMGGLLFITSATASMIWTVSKTSRSIGDSEQAYFAALTAVEEALYKYEKDGMALDELQETQPHAILGNAFYTTDATVDTYIPSYANYFSVDEETQPISNSNSLFVTIPSGKTFYISMAIPGVTYPTQVRFTNETSNDVEITSFANGIQSDQTLTYNGQDHQLNVPANGSKIKIKNLTGNNAQIEIRPTGGTLPIGIIITGTGTYRNTVRKIEVAKPAWVIY